MRDFYPAIEPYDSGMLDVGDGNHVYWETSGNPDGKPVVFLHGGPGGGTTPDHRRLFDPDAYRIVLLDQRGCGRSTPHLSDPDVDLAANTTWHLVADLELLRERLGIERWQLFGGSWGSALALAYAETHPERVTELVLRGVFTLRRREFDWVYGGQLASLFPEAWEELLAAVPEGRDTGDLLRTFAELVDDADPAVRETAAAAWSRWEAKTVTLVERPELVAHFVEPRTAAAFARIELHYFTNGGWLEEGQLIRDVGKLDGIPGAIVQGRYDAVCPPVTAWQLHRAWPGSELTVVPDAGHAFDEPGILHHLIEATDRFRRR
ncbi:prolyl aminopeptidase [Myceligenerans pegani]|uniref:Proline iminopeptidase n=1 Tax=Myceligenerans pegani TaxID=2776917 RepID=A0ABR9MXD4_9MICO|nr:prolyl aminopeptidase [Myceligenerans sp. TRM 65318]MBE1876045.1 prolyl aminopeptidase [Myceligenerans sp. TRM 65318]MBE3018316.1 prolyl aminopeptidase [Myceligenerans sp. TRM 65318]